MVPQSNSEVLGIEILEEGEEKSDQSQTAHSMSPA
jgi:hypothetical protein